MSFKDSLGSAHEDVSEADDLNQARVVEERSLGL